MKIDHFEMDSSKNRYEPNFVKNIIESSLVSDAELYEFSNYITQLKNTNPEMHSYLTDLYLDYNKIKKEVSESGMNSYRETALKTYTGIIKDHLSKKNSIN